MEQLEVQKRIEVEDSPKPESGVQNSGKARYNVWTKWLDQISYKGMVGNLPFLIFITLLCVVYITNNNRAISLTRTLNEKNKILKELRWRYMDLQSRLMFQTTETQLNQKTEALGLLPLQVPAFEVKHTVQVDKQKK